MAMGARSHLGRKPARAGWFRTGAAVAAVLLAVPAVAAAQPHDAARAPRCTITGTSGPDVLVGGPGRDVICGLGGDDILRGGGGDDILRGGPGDDVLRGGAGDDVLRGGSGGDDLLYGDAGDDVLKGSWGDDSLYGGTGNDSLYGGYGKDRVDGGAGRDTLYGGPDGDVLLGGTGNDALYGGTGNDVLRAVDGPAYRDNLACGSGTDTAANDPVDTVTGCETSSNAVPQAHDDTFGGTEDTVLTLPVTGAGSPAANDTDADGDPLTVVTVMPLAGGTVAIVAGQIRFTPTANLCAPAAGAFTYVVSDGHGGTDTARVTVPLTCVPDAPTAVDDAASVSEDAGATAVAVLANDNDPEGDPITIATVTQPAHGVVAITGGGTGLTYQPTADFCGPDTFTYTVNGGDNGGVSVTVTCVDDPPTAVADAATVDQDAAATAVDVLANDTDIDGGPMTIASATDPAHGTVVLTGGSPGARTGLTYQPDPGTCGPDSFDYTLNGGSSATVTMTVTCPDAPPVAVGDTATVAEDAGANAIDVLANDTDSDGGPKGIVSVTQPLNGTVVITGGGTGLTYAPAANYCNSLLGLTDDVTYTLNGGSSATVAVTVTCVDDDPVAVTDTAGASEDDPATAIDVLANDTDVDGGPMAIASASDPANGTVVLTGGSPGAHTGLTYQPDPNYCGPDSFTYTLAPGGSTATVNATVGCVPDAPTVTDAAGPTTYTENGAPVVVDGAVTVTGGDSPTLNGATISITGGFQSGQDALAWSDTNPADGITQGASTAQTVVLTGVGTLADYQAALRQVTYADSSENPSTVARTVTFAVDAGAAGTVSDTIGLQVNAVDDAPVAVADSATLLEDAAATAVGVLANDSDVDGGPTSIQTVTQPAHGTVVITGGGTGLTYQPDANFCGPDSFTYTLNGGSSATVSMTVTCVNDAPVADDETFTGAAAAVGNTTYVVNDPTDGAPTVSGPAKTVTGDLLAGDTDVDGPGPLTITAGTFATSAGGSVTLEADGDFTYDPPAGCAVATDGFDYTVGDQDPTSPLTDTGHVTIDLSGCVWYVSNNAAGDSGTSAAPFDTLAQAQAASSAGDTVYVFAGTGTSTGYGAGIDLKTNQRLVGQAVALQVGAATLAPAGSRPVLTDTANDVVVLGSGNTVTGVQLDPQGGGGIAGGSGDASGTIDDVRIVDTGTAGAQPGLELDGTTGAFDVSSLTVDNTAASGQTTGSIGVRLNNAGTVNFLASGTIAIAAAGAKALDVTGTTSLGANSVVDSVTVTGSGTGGVSLNGNTGFVTFGDLSLTTTSGATAAFALTNTGGVQVSAGGTANISATGGPAVDVNGGTNPLLSFDAVSSTNSASTGINLAGLAGGTFTASSGSITGAAGTAFAVSGSSSGTITYPGAIGNGSGATASVSGRTGGTVTLSGTLTDSSDAGGGITVSGNTSGSTVISGASKTFDTGAGTGVALSGNTGHTVSITGGNLGITTSSGTGFSATGGGTVEVTGTGNTVTATAGPALAITSTTIGGNDVTFQKVSSTGGANGIKLVSTGASGRLVVTGNGGTCTSVSTAGCSGGTIAGSVGADDSGTTPAGTGILLSSTLNPSFTRMWIHDHPNYAVRGSSVAGFTLATSVVNGTNGTNAAGPFSEGSIAFDGLTGSAAVSDSYVAGGIGDNVRVVNSTGDLDRITFTNDTIGANSLADGNDGILLSTNGGAGALKATVANSTFTAARGDLLQFDHNGTGAGDLVLTDNAFSNNHGGIATGGGGLTLSSGGSGTTTMSITGNSFRDADGNALTIVKTTGASTQTGTFDNNTVGVSGVADSGSVAGDGVKLQSAGGGTMTWAVTNNIVRQYNNFGIDVMAGGSATPQSGNVNATITGNTIDQPGTAAGSASIPKNAVQLNIGTVVGDTYAACAAISGNTLFSGGADAVPPIGAVNDIRLRQRQATSIRLPGYAGATNDNAAVATFLVAANSVGGTPTAIASNTVPTGGGFVGGAACATP